MRLISKFMTSQPGKEAITIHILSNIFRSKGNPTKKFDQLIEYNMRNIFLEQSYTKYGGEAIPWPFSKESKLSISLDQQCEFLFRSFFVSQNRWLPKYIETKVLTTCFYFLKALKKLMRSGTSLPVSVSLHDFWRKTFF